MGYSPTKGGQVRIKRWARAALVVAVIAGTLTAEGAVSLAEDSGSQLVEEVAPHEVGDNAQVRLESVAAFDPAGGDAVFEPGTTNEETFSYDTIDADTDRLLGLSRPAPASHATGTFVEAVAAPTPTPAASPSGEATGTDPSADPSTDPPPATSDGSEDSAGSTASEPAGAEPSGAGQAGVIPDPCDIVDYCQFIPVIGCDGCDELVAQIVTLVEECTQTKLCIDPDTSVLDGLIEDLCGTDNVLMCEDKISRALAAALGELCPNGITTCADPIINFVANLVMDVVCPSGSIGYCAGEIGAQVNERLAFVVGVAEGLVANTCGYATADACIRTIQALLDAWVFQTVCGSSNAFTCVSNLQDDVNDTVANICRGYLSNTETGDSAVTNCVEKVYDTIALVFREVGNAMIVVCQSNDPDVCLNVLVTRIKATVAGVCNMSPGSASGSDADICVERVLELVDGLVITAKQKMRETCGSDNPTTCANNVLNDLLADIEMVHDTVANVCRGYISNTSTSDSAVTNCVEKALDLADDVLFLLCQARDVNGCAANVLERIGNEIDRICMSLPGDSYATGLDECIDKTYKLVTGLIEIFKQKMRETCGSDDPATCVDNVVTDLLVEVERIHDTVANVCEGNVSTAPSTDSAVTNCSNRILDTVYEVMTIVCRSTDALTCVGNVLDDLDGVLGAVCGLAPVPDGGAVPDDPPGVGRCILKAIGTVEFVMTAACRSNDVDTCVANVREDLDELAATVHDTIANLCGGRVATEPTDADAISTCRDLVLGAVADAQETVDEWMIAVCRSTDVNECVVRVVELVNGAVSSACDLMPGTATSNGAAECVEKAIAIVSRLPGTTLERLTAACGAGDLVSCIETVAEIVREELARACLASPASCDLLDDVPSPPPNPLGAPAPTRLAVSPRSTVRQVGQRHGVLAIVLDQYNAPMPGVPVRFTRTGSASLPASSTVETNEEGQALYAYVGSSIGKDVIEAVVADGVAPPRGASSVTWVVVPHVVPGVPYPGNCPTGEPPYEAEQIPTIIPAACGVFDALIFDHGAGARVGPPSTAVWSEGLVGGANGDVHTEELEIVSLEDGTTVLFDVGSETSEADDSPVAFSHDGCDDPANEAKSWKVDGSYIWKYNVDSRPSTHLGAVESREGVKGAFRNIMTSRNECGTPDYVGAHAYYDGYTSRVSDINSNGGCQNRSRVDGHNTVDFGNILWQDFEEGKFYLGLACSYSDGGVLSEADIRISIFTRWYQNNLSCTEENKTWPYHLESLMTHEAGHVFGLAHAGTHEDHPGLTMAKSMTKCTDNDSTLGRGDMIGLANKYPDIF